MRNPADDRIEARPLFGRVDEGADSSPYLDDVVSLEHLDGFTNAQPTCADLIRDLQLGRQRVVGLQCAAHDPFEKAVGNVVDDGMSVRRHDRSLRRVAAKGTPL